MARIHGRKGKMYVDLAGGGSASPVAFLTKWSIDFVIEKVDVTSQDDGNKVYVAGLPDAKGAYNGWYDTATPQLYTAATDGIARNIYLYPTTANNGQYWFGTAIFDFSTATGSGEAQAISGAWAAASLISKVG